MQWEKMKATKTILHEVINSCPNISGVKSLELSRKSGT